MELNGGEKGTQLYSVRIPLHLPVVMSSSRALDSTRKVTNIVDQQQQLRRSSLKTAQGDSLQRRGSQQQRRPSTSVLSIKSKSISDDTADNVCQCYCTERKLYAALQTEIDALKKFLVVKEKENQRGLLYSEILQQEIEKLRAIIEKQSKDMNRSQRYLFTREASEKNLSLTIDNLQSERKSAEILEAQNLELFQRNKYIEGQLAMSKEKVMHVSDELAQTLHIKGKLLEEAVSIEAAHVFSMKQIALTLKSAEQRAEKAETALAAFRQKVAKRDQEFLLRDEILMDKVARSEQRAYKTLNLANEMTDRYYATKDAIDASNEMVHVSNSRGAIIISRLERERELLRSREIELTDEKNFLQMQIISLGSREPTPAEFSHSARAKTSRLSERRMSIGNKLAAITVNQAVQTEGAGYEEAVGNAGIDEPATDSAESIIPALQKAKRQLLSNFLCHLTNFPPASDVDDVDVLPSIEQSTDFANVVNLSRVSLNDDDVQFVVEWIRLLPLNKTKRIDLRYNDLSSAGLLPLIAWLKELAGNEFTRAALYSPSPLEIDVRHNQMDLEMAGQRLLEIQTTPEDDALPILVNQDAEHAFLIQYPDVATVAMTSVPESDDSYLSPTRLRTFLTIKIRC